MNVLLRVAAAIDAFSSALGRGMAWLILLCTLTSAAAATLRYAFDWGSNALLEAQWFMFGLVFLFCAPWTLCEGGHVRIDVLSSRLTSRTRIWIDIFGTLLFLLPVCILIAIDAWGYFVLSFRTREASPDPGGLIWWPLKLAIPIAFTLLSLQGCAEVVKNIAALRGQRPFPTAQGGPVDG